MGKAGSHPGKQGPPQSRRRAALLFAGLGPGLLAPKVQSHPLGKAPLAKLSL